MTIRLKLLNLLFFSLFCSAANAADCLKYEPDIVALNGTLHRATFPGRRTSKVSPTATKLKPAFT
mgnify:CR=1 FL=1